MLGMCLNVLAVAGVLAGGGWYYAAHFSDLCGTVPLLHAGIDWGLHEHEIPDLTGKVAVVTGANVGLGRGTAQLLAKHNAHVYFTCRSEDKCAKAVKEIEAYKHKGSKAKTVCSVVELSSLKSVQKWTKDISKELAELGGIDMLIFNAGVLGSPFGLTEDKIEWQFGVNHLGHFAMWKGLEPLVEKAEKTRGQARVVSVSSMAHLGSPKEGIKRSLKELNDEESYDRMLAYGQSKLANILFAKELQTRADEKKLKIYSNAVHPGAVDSDMARHVKKLLTDFAGESVSKALFSALKLAYWSEQDAALTSLFPAVSQEVVTRDIRGQYFVPVARVHEPSKQAKDPELAKWLWSFSEDLLKEKGF